MKIAKIQESLRTHNLDGWLFFDHHLRDPFAYKILGLETTVHVTRRWYYYIPARGEPTKLVHRIESAMLDSLEGQKLQYASWQEQQSQLQNILKESKRVAMQYSPLCAIPYVATVDAGTIELVKSCGVSVYSSAALVQEFEAQLTLEAIESHFEAGKTMDLLRAEAFKYIAANLNNGITEYQVKKFLLDRYEQTGLTTAHGPDIMANENASDPHYDPKPDTCKTIRKGDFVLIDMWAKQKKAGAIYYDITWSGYCGAVIPDRIQTIFSIVTRARDLAIEKVTSSFKEKRSLQGYQVDDAAREYITSQGYGEYFFHRTGHSIGENVHGNGANMDNLESHDERPLINNSCFSIEPGIYLPEFGIRSEINMLIADQTARVTGEIQDELVRIV